MKILQSFTLVSGLVLKTTTKAFAPPSLARCSVLLSSSTSVYFFKGGSGAKDLDEEWKAQQELLKLRKASPEEREKYFKKVEERRANATREQFDKWAWQRKQYGAGEDPIDEWRKRRESGQISDLENQYGDPEKVGGIPLPMASFGVGGEFGVGGKFDNGGRFDLRLPYAEQGWVDEDAEPLFSKWFGGGKKKGELTEASEVAKQVESNDKQPEKKGFWPF
ncbi:hypothetical protein ACHAW6_002073 [Cyclotella cf. meneghiniana]